MLTFFFFRRFLHFFSFYGGGVSKYFSRQKLVWHKQWENQNKQKKLYLKKVFANICQYKICIHKAVKSGLQRLEHGSIKGTEKLKLISPENPVYLTGQKPKPLLLQYETGVGEGGYMGLFGGSDGVGGGQYNFKTIHKLSFKRTLLIIFIFFPFFIQLPFPFLAPFFLCAGKKNPLIRWQVYPIVPAWGYWAKFNGKVCNTPCRCIYVLDADSWLKN